MQTITSTYKGEFRDKGSKFIGLLIPASTQTLIESALESVKSEHSKATHHCYAYRIDPNSIIEFTQDDGEPSGTAGAPIMNALRSANLINCILISVRYYGGTKLGKSGLINAYGECARQTIDSAKLKKVVPISRYRIIYDYPQQSLIEQLKNEFQLVELRSEYTDIIKIEFGCPLQLHDRFEKTVKTSEHLLNKLERLENSFHIES